MLERITRKIGDALSWLFLIAVLLTCFEVMMRYVFAAPTIWVHDLVTTMAALCFIFGGALASAERAHIQVASYADKAPPAVRRALAITSQLLGIIFLAMLLYAAAKQATSALALMETSGHAWDVPIPAFLKAALALGVALMLALALRQLQRSLTKRDDPLPPPSETII